LALTIPAADGKATDVLKTSTCPAQIPMDAFFATITWFGSLYLLLPSSVLLCLLFLRAGRQREAAFLALSLTISVIAVHAAKLLFRRPRPDLPDMLVPMPADWSFPSAHTTQATTFFLALTLIAIRLLPPFWATCTALVGLLLAVGVGYSRVYLQVHYLSDVIAGMVLAILLVLLVYAVLPHLHLRSGN
jgi:membrane-associated phospholipid phosphatase